MLLAGTVVLLTAARAAIPLVWAGPASLIVAAGGFAGLIAVGFSAVQSGIESRRVVQWGLLAAAGYVVLDTLLRLFLAPALVPGSYAARPPQLLFAAVGAFVLVGLPVAIGTSIAERRALSLPSPPDAPAVPKEPVAGSLMAALIIGWLPLIHLPIYVHSRSGRIDVPIYGILLLTAPIGVVMAFVAVVLCAGLSKHGMVAMMATFFYGLGTLLAFGALYLMGANFSLPP